ncbi:MAG TPA: PQQ-dependent sugar dehydrogenase [Trichormus sp.]|jgi:glucose/arabinose dehydrogenase
MKRAFMLACAVAAIVVAVVLLLRESQPPVQQSLPAPRLDQLHMPPGFDIQVYAVVPGARQMCKSPKGTIFVGSRSGGNKVYAVVDQQNGQHQVITLASNLFVPNGVAFHDKDLYIAEVNKVSRLKDIEANLNHPPRLETVNDGFSAKTHHGWKYIAFGPDGWLYVPVGAPCNVCIADDFESPNGVTIPYASMMRMKPDGSGLEVFARGIRNTVGFDWDPTTKDLWFTDNGRDLLGDNIPPDELDHAPVQGANFGFPFMYGNNQPDPEYGSKVPNDETLVPPAQCLDPHVASLGMKFYTGTMFPAEYHNQIFIAEHGSWNRSIPIGYRITLVTLKNGKPINYQPFIDGWLQNNHAWGRPVDLLQLADGSMLISDDTAGLIYRVTYKKP